MRHKMRIDNKKTARLLKDAFRSLGVPQQSICRQMGITQPQLSRIFNGRFERQSKTINALCAILKVKPIPSDFVRVT